MKTNIAAPLGGIILLAAGIALASYTASSADALSITNSKTVGKYLTMSANALKNGKISQAQKWAQKAIIVDPQNKQAISAFRQAVLASCPKSDAPAPTTSTGVSRPAVSAPKKPVVESEDEMGCI
jgi:hypothetical protein